MLPAADVPTVNGWISVKDRLPENYKAVLTYDNQYGSWREICVDCEDSFVRWYNHPEKDGGE